MDAMKRKVVEDAGWTVGDASDFLELNAEERQLLAARFEQIHASKQQIENGCAQENDLSGK